MKNLTKQLHIFILAIILSAATYAQKDMHQAYWVHVDEVNPSMMRAYEKVSKEFVEACKKHQLQDADYVTLRTDDMRYITIAPIENMGDFDKNPLAPLSEKMGEDKFNKIFEDFNKCYDRHYDAVVWLHKELSYMPEGQFFAPENEKYREFTYYYFAPSHRMKMKEVAKGFKELYKSKGSKAYYRIYSNGFGERGEYFMVSVAATSPEALAKIQADNKKLIGDSSKDLVDQLLKYTTKTETHTGYMRDDLSYTAQK